MGKKEAHQVFVSYAREDSDWVRLAVRLLRAGGARVFIDVDDIEYGDRWKSVLQESIAVCQRVLVFWSVAAASSLWVTREWGLALKLQKRVIPILLDDTPLPPQLAELHGIPELKTILYLGERRLHSSPSLSVSTVLSSLYRFTSRRVGRIAVAGGMTIFTAATLGVLLWAIFFSDSFNFSDIDISKVPVWVRRGIVATVAIAASSYLMVLLWRSYYKRVLVRESFSNYLSPEVVKELVFKSSELKLGRRFISFIFAED